MISRWSLVILAGCWMTASVSAGTPIAPRTDALGDPLPPGAVARLGTLRLKHAPGMRQNILAAVFSADSKMVATRDGNGLLLRLWEVASGKEMRGAWSQAPNTSAVAFSPDGTTMAIAGVRGTAQPNTYVALYDIPGRKEIKTLVRQRYAVTALAFDTGGKTLVTASFGTVSWWDVHTGKETRSWKPFDDEKVLQQDGSARAKWFDVCGISPDACLLAVHVATSNPSGLRPPPRIGQNPLQDQVAIGFNLATGAMTWRTEGKYPLGQASHFAFSADSKRVAIALGPDDVEVRNAINGKLVATPLDRPLSGAGRITGLALSDDGKTVAVAGSDANVMLWNVDNATTARKLVPGNDSYPAQCVQFSPDGKTLAVGVGNDMQLFDAGSLREIHPWPGHRSAVEFLAFSSDGKRLMTGSDTRNFQARDAVVWDAATWKPVQQFSAARSPRQSIGAISPDLAVYVGKMGDDRFALYDLQSGKQRARFHVPPGRPPQPQNAQLYLPQRLEGDGFFSPTGRFYVMHRQDERGRPVEGLYAVSSGKLLCLLPPLTMVFSRIYADSGSLRPIAFSPDNRLVALFSEEDGKIHVCETATGKSHPPLGPGWGIDGKDALNEQQRIALLYAFAGSLAFSHDSKLLASWNTLDNVLHIWDVARATEVQRLTVAPPREGVVGFRVDLANRVYFSWAPDNRTLAVGLNKIQIWELATGRIRQEWPGHDGAALRALAFAPGGRFLASGSTDTTVLVWDMSLVEQAVAVESGETVSLATRWHTLAEDDAARAFAAIRALTATPDAAVAWIKERLKPALMVERKHIDTLIAQLDDSGFRARQKATAELVQIGERALPAIDQALVASPTLETRRRLDEVRKRLTSRMLSGQSLQAHRAVEVLERIGTLPARDVLKLLAHGAPGALLTTQAEEALGRLPK